MTLSNSFELLALYTVQSNRAHSFPAQASVKVCVCVYALSHVWLFVMPWTLWRPARCRSTQFFRQEYWNGLPFPTPGDLPNSGLEPTSLGSLHWQADWPLYHLGSPQFTLELLMKLYLTTKNISYLSIFFLTLNRSKMWLNASKFGNLHCVFWICFYFSCKQTHFFKLYLSPSIKLRTETDPAQRGKNDIDVFSSLVSLKLTLTFKVLYSPAYTLAFTLC